MDRKNHTIENKLPSENIPVDVPDIPERYLLDLTTRCNLRCPMCPVWGNQENKKAQNIVKGEMPIEQFYQILDQIKHVKPLVQPNMYGEPLISPLIRDQVAAMKKKDISVAINTNGLLLTQDLAENFVKHQLDSISFSIDAITPETLGRVRGIKNLSKIEKSVFLMNDTRNNNENPRISVSFTKQKENHHEVDEFVSRWLQHVDCVRIGLKYEKGHFVDMPAQQKRKPCPSLYNTMAIHNDGIVTICCLDGFKTTNMGNVFTHGIKEVWKGDAFRKVRYYHETGQYHKIPICKNCNGWAQYEFKETVKEGILIRESPQLTYYNRIDRLNNWNGALLGGHKKATI